MHYICMCVCTHLVVLICIHLNVDIHYVFVYAYLYSIQVHIHVGKFAYVPPPKTVLYLIVVGGEQPSRGMPGGAMPSGVKAIG